MSVAPGVYVSATAARPPAASLTDTGTWFAAGLAERGPTGVAVEVRSLGAYQTIFGGRHATLHDAVDGFFRVGGSRAYVSRVVGPAAAASSLTLVDRAGTPVATLKVDAYGSGDWGDDLEVAVANGTGSDTFVLIVTLDGAEVERSPDLGSPAAAVAWADGYSDYLRVTDLASGTAAPGNNPAVAPATALTGGDSDESNITDDEWLDALDVFAKDLGPGQASAPGRTSDVGYTQVADHAEAHNRVAVLDGTDTATVATLVADGDAVRVNGNPEFAGMFAPWPQFPGPSRFVPITVPPSAVVAGVMSRLDVTADTAVAAAGRNGDLLAATGLSQPAWSDADRAALNDAGINVITSRRGSIQVYGYRTLQQDGSIPYLTIARLLMEIKAVCEEAAQEFVFATIDGRGRLYGEFRGALEGVLLPFWQSDALYGDTPDQAFRVVTAAPVNTPATAQAGELHAQVEVRPSGLAEFVLIRISQRLLSETIA